MHGTRIQACLQTRENEALWRQFAPVKQWIRCNFSLAGASVINKRPAWDIFLLTLPVFKWDRFVSLIKKLVSQLCILPQKKGLRENVFFDRKIKNCKICHYVKKPLT
jgi:hypothetical protein